jgi:hypothetical protein
MPVCSRRRRLLSKAGGRCVMRVDVGHDGESSRRVAVVGRASEWKREGRSVRRGEENCRFALAFAFAFESASPPLTKA